VSRLSPAYASSARAQPSPRRHRDGVLNCWVVNITQGETYATGEEDVAIATVLGSCIAACIRDPYARIGGMNHFLLPDGDGGDRLSSRYGVNAMELLINAILHAGGRRDRLQAKIFGGANVIPALSNIGERNAQFARTFLKAEGIELIGDDTGGTLPRRVRFWPESGRASRLLLAPDVRAKVADEEMRTLTQNKTEAPAEGNDVELF